MDDIAIKFSDVWEKYRIKFIRKGKNIWEEFWALKDVSFNIKKGEAVGIVGNNGAGKTTILKLVAGMLKPDKGKVEVNGKISALMELGAGFHPEVTGRENIILNAGLYGLTENEIKEKFADIVEFSGIGKFIDSPIKYYSQGMYMRLAFSLAIHVEPDILLIDDILAVGDEIAKRKCLRKIENLKKQNKTILIVSHDLHMLPLFCERLILLRKGKILKEGLPDKLIEEYLETAEDKRDKKSLIRNGRKLIFDNGKIGLKFNDSLLTKGPGFYTSFCLRGLSYAPQVAEWKTVDFNRNNYLILKGYYKKLLLEQEYRFEVDKNGDIFWEVKFIPKENIDLEELDINLMLSEDYTGWFSPENKDEFPLISHKDNKWTDLLQKNYSWSYLGVISESLPSVVIEFDDVSERNFSKIYNGKYLMKSRCLQLKHIFVEGFKKGKAERFSGRIILEEDFLDDYLPKECRVDENEKLGLPIFKKGDLCLKYNQDNKWNIFWKDIELTKKLGIYTSMNLNGRWFDSSGADWDFLDCNKDRFVSRLIWKRLPLIQKWKVKLVDDNAIEWIVDLEVLERIKFLRHQGNLMLSELYKKWFTYDGKLTRKFPGDFKRGDDGEWFKAWSSTSSSGIGVEKVKKSGDIYLPSIIFSAFFLIDDYLVNIVNSDEFQRARVLQCTIDREKEIYPGKYNNYFSGKILVKE